MSHPANTPPIRAYAVVHNLGHLPTLAHDQARAAQIAASTHGVAHDLYTAPALLAHIATMNKITPDPAGVTASGAIQHMALCMTIANKAVLHTVRMGWPVSDTDGTWWIDTAPLLDPTVSGEELIGEAQQHLAVALFAGLVTAHPVHATWVRIISTIGQPASDASTAQQVPA